MLCGVDAPKSTLDHPSLLVDVEGGRPTKMRKLFQIGGMSPPVQFIVHNSSVVNLVRGILERVYYVKLDGVHGPPPKPIPGAFSHLGGFRSLLIKYVSRTAPMKREDFSSLYQGRKQTIYQQAYLSLLSSPITLRDSYLNTFVKAEKVDRTKKIDPVPRVIQPRHPRYNMEVGRYLKPLESKLYQAVARIFDDVTIFKGLNAAKAGALLYRKWRGFRQPIAIGLDASRFDQHVSVDALQWEHSCYQGCFSGSDRDELSRLLKWQLCNRGSGRCADGKVAYTVNGCRMSGDMNTALGNCVIMCAIVYSLGVHCNVKLSLANNGDDCVVIMEREDAAAFMAVVSPFFLDFGFTIKVEQPVFVFEQIEFCQTHPVCVGPSEYIMVRNCPTSLAKDCLSIKSLDSQSLYERQCTALGECGMALTGGVPICQEFNQSLIRAGRSRKFRGVQEMTGKDFLRHGMTRYYKPVDSYTRYSFWLAFGITPGQQRAIENYYRGFTPYWNEPIFDNQLQCLPEWFNIGF